MAPNKEIQIHIPTPDTSQCNKNEKICFLIICLYYNINLTGDSVTRKTAMFPLRGRNYVKITKITEKSCHSTPNRV